jgi:hypothetical protein
MLVSEVYPPGYQLSPSTSAHTLTLSLRTHAYYYNLDHPLSFPIQLASITSKLIHSPITVLPLSILSAVIFLSFYFSFSHALSIQSDPTSHLQYIFFFLSVDNFRSLYDLI